MLASIQWLFGVMAGTALSRGRVCSHVSIRTAPPNMFYSPLPSRADKINAERPSNFLKPHSRTLQPGLNTGPWFLSVLLACDSQTDCSRGNDGPLDSMSLSCPLGSAHVVFCRKERCLRVSVSLVS